MKDRLSELGRRVVDLPILAEQYLKKGSERFVSSIKDGVEVATQTAVLGTVGFAAGFICGEVTAGAITPAVAMKRYMLEQQQVTPEEILGVGLIVGTVYGVIVGAAGLVTAIRNPKTRYFRFR